MIDNHYLGFCFDYLPIMIDNYYLGFYSDYLHIISNKWE